MALDQRKVLIEPAVTPGMRWRPALQVRQGLTECQVEAFNKAGVESLGVFRLEQRFGELAFSAEFQAPLDTDDAIVAAGLITCP